MNKVDVSWMIGRKIEVEFSEPFTWFFAMGNSLCISVVCPWRLIYLGHIAVSADDHLQKFGLPSPIDASLSASALLADSAIHHVEIREGTLDLLIDLEGDKRLEIIPFSSGYESWQVSTPTGQQIIAQGGGNIISWHPPKEPNKALHPTPSGVDEL